MKQALTKLRPTKLTSLKKEEPELATAAKLASPTESTMIVEEECKQSIDQPTIPPPFDKYFDKSWFPKESIYDKSAVTLALIAKFKIVEPLVLKELLLFIVDIHK